MGGSGDNIIKSITGMTEAGWCQKICESNNECTWFNWGTHNDPHMCLLLKTKGTTKLTNGLENAVTGPKSCGGNSK